MSPTEIARLAQAITTGPWRHASAAMEACLEETWPDFVRASAPPRALLGLLSHRRCVAIASTTFSGPREVTAELIPIWICDTDDEPSTEWYSAHAERLDGGELSIVETGPRDKDVAQCLGARVSCRAQVWQVGIVVLSRNYAPDIPMLVRHGDYAVLQRDIIRVIEAQALPGGELIRPSLTVPRFCSWVEPRVEGLPAEVVTELRALSVTTDEEGRLIPRPPPGR